MTQDTNGRPLVQVVESGSGVGKEREQGSAPPALPSSASCDERATRAFAKPEVDASAARAFADTLVGLVPAGGIRTAQAPPAPPNVEARARFVSYSTPVAADFLYLLETELRNLWFASHAGTPLVTAGLENG